MVATIFQDAGISGKTNHSLHVTGTTCIYNSGILRKLSRAGLDTRGCMSDLTRSSKLRHAGTHLYQFQPSLVLPIVLRLHQLLSTWVVPACLFLGALMYHTSHSTTATLLCTMEVWHSNLSMHLLKSNWTLQIFNWHSCVFFTLLNIFFSKINMYAFCPWFTQLWISLWKQLHSAL